MARYRFIVEADLGDATEQQVLNVLADAAVQVTEPVLERPDDGSEVLGTATAVVAVCAEVSAGGRRVIRWLT